MNRKANSGTSPKDAPAATPTWASAGDMTEAMQTLQKATEPLLDWANEVRASQAAALAAYTHAMQCALDAVIAVGRPSGVWQAQGELVGTAIAQASRLQREAMAGWLAGLGAPAASETSLVPKLSEGLQQAKDSYEAAMRPWTALMNGMSAGKMPSA
jgi:hypothetical protein